MFAAHQFRERKIENTREVRQRFDRRHGRAAFNLAEHVACDKITHDLGLGHFFCKARFFQFFSKIRSRHNTAPRRVNIIYIHFISLAAK